MRNKFAAATRPSSPIAGASPTDGIGPGLEVTPEIVSHARRAVHPVRAAYARQAAERRIEAALGFATLYALGAADGPDVDRLKIGVAASEPALAEELRKAQHYNSRRIVMRMRVYVVGKPVALRVKADVAGELSGAGRHLHGSWYRIGAEELRGLTAEIARVIGVELLDDAARQARVLEAIEREMERAVRG